MDSKDKAVCIANLAADKKAEDIILLDIKKLSSIADYIIICTGISDRQVQAIAEHIESALKKKKVVSIGTEGIREGRWALIDYGDVIVHIFCESLRLLYNLEGLWAEASRLTI
ncbi:MAG: ribosome silencing factor [Deltaproteobacteria bacterium GWC2_42_11]|nr:MAG: ribosome silencing factor [Deltaproteobacteria bacterium GWC2_42_11]HBO84881.1 ribosome silencing factor [Deltaproteobacteria bacterium]